MKKFTLNLLIVICGIILVLLMSTIAVAKFKPLYSYSIEILKIEDSALISKDEMKENYNYVIDYLFNDEKAFNLPTLPSSEDGAVHFWEVKKLFQLGIGVMVLSLIILAFAIVIYNKRFKDKLYLKYLSRGLIITPLALIIVISLNFNYFFTIFHKIFFNNDKWLFDPRTDPIINILPEEYFALCAGAIGFLVIFFGIGLMLLNRHLRNKENSTVYPH